MFMKADRRGKPKRLFSAGVVFFHHLFSTVPFGDQLSQNILRRSSLNFQNSYTYWWAPGMINPTVF